MRLGRIVEGRAIRDRLEFGKADSTRTLSHFRSAAAWDEFLAELFEELDGTGRNLLIEIEELRNRTWGPVARRKRRLHPVKFVQKRSRTPLVLTFPDTSLFIKVVKRLERKIDERLRSSTNRIAANRGHSMR